MGSSAEAMADPPGAPAPETASRRSARRRARRRRILTRVLVTLLVGVIGWLAVTVNLARFFARERDEPLTALHWRPDHPLALAAVAQRKVGERAPDAADWVERALRAFPTSGALYAQRAVLALQAGDEAAARAAMARADRLAPSDPAVQRALASLAADLDDPAAILRHLTRVGHQGWALDRLAALAEHPRTAALVRALAADAPDWWPDLLVRVARRGRQPESVEPLLQATTAAGRPIPEPVTQARIDRLQRAGDWRRAYLLWLDSLDERQLAEVGFLYNGVFRLPLADADFGWRRRAIGGARVERGEPDGPGNGWALYAHFPVGRYQFRHVHQKLVLPPGHYRLSGEVRTGRLETPRGFSWVLRCLGRGGDELGRTDPVADSPGWQAFEVAFQVSADCPAQELRLVLDGRHGREFDVRGTFWTRDLAIGRFAG